VEEAMELLYNKQQKERMKQYIEKAKMLQNQAQD
jgi:hypothetical protein